MRFSIILTISTAIYFAATNIHAVPIPSCEGDAGDCAPSTSGTLLSGNPGNVNPNALTAPGAVANVKTSLRRRSINNKRDQQPGPTGPAGGALEAVQPALGGATAPVTGALTGPTTNLGMVTTGVGGLASPPGQKDLDPNAKLTELNGQVSSLTGGVDGTLKGVNPGGGPSANSQGAGQG